MSDSVIPTVEDFKQAKTDLGVINQVVNSAEAKDIDLGGGKKLPTMKKLFARLESHNPFRNRGAWKAGLTYSVNDIWQASDKVWYSTLEEYVSGANEQADIDSGKVQVHQVNIRTDVAKDAAELKGRNPSKEGELVFLLGIKEPGVGSGWFRSVLVDAPSPDGGRVIGAWVRDVSGSINAEMYGADESESDALQRAIDSTSEPVYLSEKYSAPGLRLSAGKGLTSSGQLQARLKLSKSIEMSGGFASVRSIVMDTRPDNDGVSDDHFAIELKDDGFNSFGHLIENSRTRGKNGIKNSAIETKIRGHYGYGTGSDSGGTGIVCDNWDMSIDGCILQDYGNGVVTYNGIQASDLHIVRSENALTIREQGQASQLVNTYLDTPRKRGLFLIDQSNITMNATYVLNVGSEKTKNESAGLWFNTNSSNNNLNGVHFIQNDASYLANSVFFEGVSINNNLYAFSGFCKLSETQRRKMRRQSVLLSHGAWARYNNIPRKNRDSVSIASGVIGELEFWLDYSFDGDSYNTHMYRGDWVARTSNSKAGFGSIKIPILFDDKGCQPVLNKENGHAEIDLEIIEANLDGYTLKVKVRNNGPVTTTLSVQLERGLDAAGRHF